MGVLLMIVWMILGFNAIVNIICFFWPAYLGIKSMATESTVDDAQWLIYSMIFCFFNTMESLNDSLLNEYWTYVFVKGGFLIWCFLPQTKGAEVVYEYVAKALSSIV